MRKKNKGIWLGYSEIKISELADDTSFILYRSKEILLETFDILQSFLKMSSLYIIFLKLTLLGSDKNYSDEVLFPKSKVHWGSTNFTLLGIHFAFT